MADAANMSTDTQALLESTLAAFSRKPSTLAVDNAFIPSFVHGTILIRLSFSS